MGGARVGMNQYPIQDVAPSAVRIAEAIDTMICTINLAVSFFVIAAHFSLFTFN